MKKLSLDLKKHTLLIIIGGLLLVIGVILYNGKKTETYFRNRRIDIKWNDRDRTDQPFADPDAVSV